MLAIDDLEGLIELVQAGVVEIHPWGSTVEQLEKPDRLIFDLDPGDDVPWSAVIEAAFEVRDGSKTLGLQSFVKTSGGKGLHVVVPVEPSDEWERRKEFTQSIAEAMAQGAAGPLRRQHDQVARGAAASSSTICATAAAPPRSPPTRPARCRCASVSTPLAWDELSEGIRADHFKIDNLRQRLDVLRQEPWPDFFTMRQRLPAGEERRD